MIVDVSVLITCKDKEPYLDECVSSVLRQTKQPREIIIVHDGCDTPMHHVEATTIMLRKNIGVAHARHEAFRYSAGSLLLFLDGDDMLSPDYIEKMVLTISRGADIAYPDIYFFGDTGNSLTIALNKFDLNWIKKNQKLPIPVTCLMKRNVYESLAGFRTLPILEDLDFWLRAMCKGYIFKKSQTLLWYRQQGLKRNAMDLMKKKRYIADIFSQFIIENNTIRLAE